MKIRSARGDTVGYQNIASPGYTKYRVVTLKQEFVARIYNAEDQINNH